MFEAMFIPLQILIYISLFQIDENHILTGVEAKFKMVFESSTFNHKTNTCSFDDFAPGKYELDNCYLSVCFYISFC